MLFLKNLELRKMYNLFIFTFPFNVIAVGNIYPFQLQIRNFGVASHVSGHLSSCYLITWMKLLGAFLYVSGCVPPFLLIYFWEGGLLADRVGICLVVSITKPIKVTHLYSHHQCMGGLSHKKCILSHPTPNPYTQRQPLSVLLAVFFPLGIHCYNF